MKWKLPRLMRTLLDTLPDFQYIKDAQCRFLFANEAVVRALGAKTLDEILGKTDIDLQPTEFTERYYADEQALLASGQPLVNQEEPFKDQETGEIRWFLTSKIPFRDRRGNIAGLVGINRDITRHKRIEEELAQRIKERTEELEILQRAIKQISSMVQRLGHTSEKLDEISSQMASEAEQTSQQVSLVSSNSQQISQHTTSVSVAVEEFAANIQETSRAITHVTDIVANAVNLVNNANSAMTDLEARSQEIGDISKMITSIAQQTRFLALNATIEAARVGEFGQGFKVVAGEVKELANETSGAAENIVDKIDLTQASSRETAQAITEVLDSIKQVSEMSTIISAAITEQTQTTADISRTVCDVAQGSQDITHAIADIASASQGAATRALDVQNEAREISSLAEQLRQLMKELNVQSK